VSEKCAASCSDYSTVFKKKCVKDENRMITRKKAQPEHFCYSLLLLQRDHAQAVIPAEQGYANGVWT